MKQTLEHSFEAVSILTTHKGMLDVTIVPALNQPDWIIPSSLIISVEKYSEYASTYRWQQQELAVFHLIPPSQTPDKIVILEGNTSEYRVALQTAGELNHLQSRISDIKDIDLPEYLVGSGNGSKIDVEERVKEDVVLSYLFQTVTIDDTVYLVPDLEKIAHQLVDLNS